MIRFRIDVDYPYTSRIRSFIYTILGIRIGKDYLKNCKIIAKMINQSRKETKAFWFFTPKTIPDKELLTLLDNPKHEVALHIINDPYEELRNLKRKTNRRIGYYTIHGTAHILARMMWKRWKSKAPRVPEDFPLQSFHQFSTTGIDSLCYSCTIEQAIEKIEESVAEGDIIYFHPIWLFQRGTLNHRGPFYEVLGWLLDVN